MPVGRGGPLSAAYAGRNDVFNMVSNLIINLGFPQA